MQVAEVKKSTSSAPTVQARQHPFFSKEGEGRFFSKSEDTHTSFFSPQTVQPKLTVGAPDDQYEREADSVADRVVQQLSEPGHASVGLGTTQVALPNQGTLQTKCAGCEEEEKLQKKEKPLITGITGIQRKPIFESNAEIPEGEVQRKAQQAQGEVPSGVMGQLNTSKGNGTRLEPRVQQSMNSGFGADFSRVRVHTGSHAIQMARDLNAQAFTHGSDIYFNQGKYDPGSTSGRHLLAHELTHTVQQGAVKSGTPQTVQRHRESAIIEARHPVNPGMRSLIQQKSDTTRIHPKNGSGIPILAFGSTPNQAPFIQSKCDECEKEAKDEKLQKVQLKLAAASDDPGDPNNPNIQRRALEMEKTDYPIMFRSMPNIQRSGSSSSPAGSRDAIVAEAQKLVGKIEAKKDDGSGRRVGADQLLEIFHLAAKDAWPDQVIEKAGQQGFPHWCGIFTVYAIKKAGIDLGFWQVGKGVSSFGTLQPTDNPLPGDVGYFKLHQHHCIIKKVNGDSIDSIDGNSGNFSEVKEKTRQKSEFLAFFTPFTGAEKFIQSKGDSAGSQHASSNGLEDKLAGSSGKGASLSPETQGRMERGFGADFSGVNIHSDNRAAELSEELGAQAFTHGNDIYFNKGKYNPDTTSGQHLLAHELTHTVQQGASVKRKIDRSESLPIRPVNGMDNTPDLQREEQGIGSKIWNATGGKLVDAAGKAIEFSETVFWQVVERFGNSALVSVLRQIKREGVLGFFKGKLMQAVNGIFDGLQNSSDKVSAIFPQFGTLVLRARTIVSALSNGDCKPLFAAMNELKDIVSDLAGKAWDAIVDFFQPAIDFFTKMWNSLALPAIEWVKEKAAHVWNWIKKIGKDIWDWYAPVRNAVSAAWDWLKGILGLNADETGEEGLIQWAQRKIEEVWEDIKAKLKPIIEPAKQLVAKIKMILPLTAILNLRKTIQDWLKKVVATATTMGDDASNVQNEGVQTSLRDQILPAIQQSIERFRGSITEAAGWVNGKIGAVFSSVKQLFTSVRSISWLSIAASAINWIETKTNEVQDWVESKVTALFDMVSEGLHKFGKFLRPIYDALMKIFEVLGNILGKLPDFLMGPLWMMLPACIKDPIKQFFIEQILGRMPFFQKLQKVENIWERLKNAAITILKQIFIDGNLKKAIWSFFSTMLDIIGIPAQLVTRVLAKGAQALNDILEDPLGFLWNFIKALKLGFEQFFGKIGSYLLSGLQAWLFSQLEGTDIEMPKDFSFRSMLKLVFQVLGITVDMIAEQIQKVFPEKRGLKAKIIKYASAFGKVWDFFERLLTDDEQGGTVWDRLEKEIGNLWDMILDGVAGWLEGTIVKKALAWVVTKLDPTGVMAVITTVIDIFNVLQAVADKAREILEMIERVLDGLGELIKGIIGAAANVFEKALGAAIPVVLALLASLFGLDGVVDQIKETIKKIRLKVEQGVEKIIRAIKGFVEKLFSKDDKDKKDSIDAALVEIDTEGEKEMDEGEVKPDEAQLIKNKVNQDHPSVINITSVTDGGETWDFEYVQKKTKKTPKKSIPTSTDAKYSDLYAEKFGKGAYVEILTKKLGNNIGSKPPKSSAGPDEWRLLVLRMNNENRSFYVQGHLLNMELGGPGQPKNLTPITQKANSEHLHQIEKQVKEKIKKGAVVSYTVWAEYGRSIDSKLLNMVVKAIQLQSNGKKRNENKNELNQLELIKSILFSEKFVPNQLIYSASELEDRNGEWKEKSKIGQDRIIVDIDNEGVDDIEELKDLYL